MDSVPVSRHALASITINRTALVPEPEYATPAGDCTVSALREAPVPKLQRQPEREEPLTGLEPEDRYVNRLLLRHWESRFTLALAVGCGLTVMLRLSVSKQLFNEATIKRTLYVPVLAYDLVGDEEDEVVPSPKAQAEVLALVLLLVKLKLFPRKHWLLFAALKAATGCAWTVTVRLRVSRQPAALTAISRML